MSMIAMLIFHVFFQYFFVEMNKERVVLHEKSGSRCGIVAANWEMNHKPKLQGIFAITQKHNNYHLFLAIIHTLWRKFLTKTFIFLAYTFGWCSLFDPWLQWLIVPCNSKPRYMYISEIWFRRLMIIISGLCPLPWSIFRSNCDRFALWTSFYKTLQTYIIQLQCERGIHSKFGYANIFWIFWLAIGGCRIEKSTEP